MQAFINIRMQVIPSITSNKDDLLLDKLMIKATKKQNPATNHKFRVIFKLFIKSLQYLLGSLNLLTFYGD